MRVGIIVWNQELYSKPRNGPYYELCSFMLFRGELINLCNFDELTNFISILNRYNGMHDIKHSCTRLITTS